MRHAIVILAPEDTPEGRGRIVHALGTARDLAVAGHEVQVLFEGIGVTVLSSFVARDNPFTQTYGPLFDEVRPLMTGACDFCARRRFDVAGQAESLGIDLIGGMDQHHSLAHLLTDSWQLITF